MGFFLKKHNIDNIFFIGIGGIGMSGLAELLISEGCKVKGTDTGESQIIERLKKMGAVVYNKHDAKNVESSKVVVYTDAIRPDNPELLRAKELGLEIYDRASFLGEVMKLFPNSVCVSGTHGKTTTTSMIASITTHTQMDPTILLGGELDEIGGNIRIGKGNIIISEACEYKANILKYNPTMAMILNIDEDHLDFYKNIDDIIATFKKYADDVPSTGYVVYNKDDEHVLEAIKDVTAKTISFGVDSDADYKAENITYDENGCANFDLIHNNKITEIKLSVLGKHNVYNALAAIAMANTYGASLEDIKKYILLYAGVHRRIETKGYIGSVRIIDDYAHHPTEIMATLEAVKKMAKGRIITIFQPHTFTRTQKLLQGFAEAFKRSDVTIITDIYAAREKDTKLVHSKDLINSMKEHGYDAMYISKFEDIENYLLDNLRENDIILTVGAGNIYKLGEDLLKIKDKQ